MPLESILASPRPAGEASGQRAVTPFAVEAHWALLHPPTTCPPGPLAEPERMEEGCLVLDVAAEEQPEAEPAEARVPWTEAPSEV